MPYKKYTLYRSGKKYFAMKNIKTGRVTKFKSKASREKGIRLREAFSHGWKPTRIKK